MSGVAPAAAWVVHEWRAPADELHGVDLLGHEGVGEPTHAAWFLDASAPALVIGSTQPDPSTTDLPVVRRRSGGGAVLVGDVSSTWLDLVIPRSSPLWVDDVGAAMYWVGETWAAALGALGVPVVVHRGGLRHSEWSRTVCFAGLGPGEVLDADGRKVVGVSQRRTRAGARFQSIAYHDGPIARIVDALDMGDDRAIVAAELSSTSAVATVDPVALRAALVAHLPRLG
jgi:lipoate---protein ligase